MLTAIIVNDYQAKLLVAALEVLRTETEAVIHATALISDDPDWNDEVITCLQMAEESDHLKKKIIRQINCF